MHLLREKGKRKQNVKLHSSRYSEVLWRWSNKGRGCGVKEVQRARVIFPKQFI